MGRAKREDPKEVSDIGGRECLRVVSASDRRRPSGKMSCERTRAVGWVVRA